MENKLENPYAFHYGQANGKLMIATDIKLFMESLTGTPEDKLRKTKIYLEDLQKSYLEERAIEKANFEDYE